MMPSTTRLTAASPPALGCKCGPAEEGACCAATFAAAKTATVTIKPKRVAVRCKSLLQAIICLRKRRLVISLGHLGKTFHVHEPESGGEWPPVCLRTMIGRVWDVSPNRVLETQSAFPPRAQPNVFRRDVHQQSRSFALGNQSLTHHVRPALLRRLTTARSTLG